MRKGYQLYLFIFVKNGEMEIEKEKSDRLRN